MEKLKNLVNPGGSKESEILYGAGSSDHHGDSGHAGRSTAEGSHVAGGTAPGSHPTDHGHSTRDHTSRTAAGPHSSDLANRGDPRVDSDRDGSRALGTGTHHGTSGVGSDYHDNTGLGYGTTGTDHSHLAGGTGSGTHHVGHGTSTYDPGSRTTTDPHASHMANKADPRVDSDRDGSRALGAGALGAGALGAGAMYGGSGGGSGYRDTTGAGYGTTGRTAQDPLVGGVNKPLPHTPQTGYTGTGATHGGLPDRTVPSSTGHGSTVPLSSSTQTPTTTGPHSSHTTSKGDSYVDTDKSGHHGSGGILGGLLGGLGAKKAHDHHSHETRPTDTDQTAHHGTGTLGSHKSHDHPSHQTRPVGTDQTAHHGAGPLGGAGTLASHDQHAHHNQPADVSHSGHQKSGILGGILGSHKSRDHPQHHDQSTSVPGHAHADTGLHDQHSRHDRTADVSQPGRQTTGVLGGIPGSSRSHDYPTHQGHSTMAPGHGVSQPGHPNTGILGGVPGSSRSHDYPTHQGHSTMAPGHAVSGPGSSGTHAVSGTGTSGNHPDTSLRTHYHLGHSLPSADAGHGSEWSAREGDHHHAGSSANRSDPLVREGDHHHTGPSTYVSDRPLREGDHHHSGPSTYGSDRPLREGDHHRTGPSAAAGTGLAAGALAGGSRADPHDPSTGPAPSTAGPHKSNILNKLDPRVDSDLDGSRTFGSVPGTAGNHDVVNTGERREPHSTGLTRGGQQIVGREPDSTYGSTGAGAYDTGAHHGQHGLPTSTASSGYGGAAAAAGPHRSGAANTIDPRVDLDHPGSRTTTAAPARDDHHYGRDAAMAGGAAAVGGAALHGSDRHHGQPPPAYDIKDDPHPHEDSAGRGHGSHGLTHHGKDKDVGRYREDPHHTTGAEHGHEQKKGGVLGFLHRDKDKDHDKDHGAPTHKEHHLHEHDKSVGRGDHKVELLGGTRDKNPDMFHDDPRHHRSTTPQHIQHERNLESLGLIGAHDRDRAYDKPHDERRHHDTTHNITDDNHHDRDRKGGVLGGLFSHDKSKDTTTTTTTTTSGHSTEHPSSSSRETGIHQRGPTTTHTDDGGRTRLHKDNPELSGDEQRRRQQGLPDGVVIEPHTGLPMDVGKYGTSGAGGTDNTPGSGYHRH